MKKQGALERIVNIEVIAISGNSWSVLLHCLKSIKNTYFLAISRTIERHKYYPQSVETY